MSVVVLQRAVDRVVGIHEGFHDVEQILVSVGGMGNMAFRQIHSTLLYLLRGDGSNY